MRKQLAAIALVTLLIAIIAIPVFADHFLGNDSVDNGEIRWEDYTQYDVAREHAISVWNDLGQVNIAPDVWNTTTDLEWIDFTDCTTDASAVWGPRIGADVLGLNVCALFDPNGSHMEKVVAAHELGHALGIANHGAGWEGILMYEEYMSSAPTAPQQHDRDDYNTLWGN